jgi:hypothetical protein
MRNIPFSLKLYAALAFLAAAGALWRSVELVVHHGSMTGIAWELLWAAFEIGLGIGIVQLRPAARVAAIICCWFVFILFAIVLVCWCIWPQSVSLAVVAVIGAATALNLYFYMVFRRTDIQAMFHLASSRPL